MHPKWQAADLQYLKVDSWELQSAMWSLCWLITWLRADCHTIICLVFRVLFLPRKPAISDLNDDIFIRIWEKCKAQAQDSTMFATLEEKKSLPAVDFQLWKRIQKSDRFKVSTKCKRVCTKSWLWEKNPLLHQGTEPASVACQSNALPTELYPHPELYPRSWLLLKI